MKKIPDNQITFYQSQDGSVNIEVMYAEENIWLTQKKMAELFDCSSDNISLHLKNIYNEKELDQSSTTEDFSAVQNKLHFAITGETATEIITNRVSSKKNKMGLTSWRKSPLGKISHEVAESIALKEFEKYKKVQDKSYTSDFDLFAKKLLKQAKK